MEKSSDGGMELQVKLPLFLDIHARASPPKEFDPDFVGEWGAFGDSDGRMITQRIDLVFNEPERKSDDQKDEGKSNSEHNEQSAPGFVLVVATDGHEDLSQHMEFENEIFAHDPQTSYQSTESWVDKQEDARESLLSHRNLGYEMIFGDSSKVVLGDEDFDGYPCLKSTWYLRKPVNGDALIDDMTIVNTQALAGDIRRFLKRHSIPLSSYAKCHLNRTQSTLSDLLNHPKPWAQLSNKGRDIYVKLMQFLSNDDLPLLTALLRRKQSSMRREKLPNNILEPLSHGVMPSEKKLSVAASCSNISFNYLKSHCENQIKLYNLQEMVMGHPLVLQDIKGKPDGGNMLKPHICAYSGCGVILPDKAMLEMHTKSHFRSKPQKCTSCNRSFATKVYLNFHLKVHTNALEKILETKDHNASEMENHEQFDVNPDAENGTELTSLRYICGTCWRGFKSRQRLLKHMSLVHLVEEKCFNEGFTCYVCRKILKNLASLEVHMRTHTNNRPYQCDQCEKSFQTKGNLQRHMKAHTGEKPYACKECPAKFIEAKSLAAHIRKHTGERPLKCEVCGKRFSQLSVLKAHLLIHEEKKPFSCEVCGRHFRQKANLMVHMKRHRGVRNHKCTMCHMAFLTRSDFDRHIRKHTGVKLFHCNYCLKCFTRRVYLRDHLKRLFRPSAPQCQSCNKKFCNDSLLKKHLVTHGIHYQKNYPHNATPRKENDDDNQQSSDTFVALDNSEDNVLLLAAKSALGNEKHFVLAQMQTPEGGQPSLDDRSTIGNFQPVVLTTAEDTTIPFSSAPGDTMFLQGIDIPGSQVSDILFAADSNYLTAVRGVNIPMTLSDEDEALKTNHEVIDVINPSLQYSVTKNDQEMASKRIKLTETDEACQVLVSNPVAEGNLPVFFTLRENATLNAETELDPRNVLISTPEAISGTNHSHVAEDDSKGRTYIIVDLELES